MDVIDLPVLPLKTTLVKARAAMESAGRAGVLVVVGQGVWLLKAGAILHASDHGKQTLADLRRVHAVHLVTPAQADARGVDFLEPHRAGEASEQLLDEVGRSYFLAIPEAAVLAAGGSLAFARLNVITRYERLAQELRGAPTAWYCTDPRLGDEPHHINPPVRADRRCPFDGSALVAVQ